MKRLLFSLAGLGGLALPAAPAVAHPVVVRDVHAHRVIHRAAPFRWEHRHYPVIVGPRVRPYPCIVEPVPVAPGCLPLISARPGVGISIQAPPFGIRIGI
jgi:hypothetical protein